jgi:spoIIIJ-associated protein
MKEVKISAKTVEEAIELALEKLGVGREAVEVDVLSEGSRGVFGIGTEEAKVRVRLIETELPEEAGEPSRSDAISITQGVLEAILAKMGLTATVAYQAEAVVQEVERTPSPIVFNVEGENLGILIGRRGQTLACLQYIVRLIVGNQTKALVPPIVPIVIDVNSYKQRRYQTLRELAQRIAEQVEASGKPFPLEPMPAYERRIIHLALIEHPKVTTQSTGLGEARKVVILPREQ